MEREWIVVDSRSIADVLKVEAFVEMNETEAQLMSGNISLGAAIPRLVTRCRPLVLAAIWRRWIDHTFTHSHNQLALD